MIRFESRTVGQILAEKKKAMQITEQRLEEVPERLAALVGQGIIGSQMAEDLTEIHEQNEDGFCPVADQIYRLLDVLNDPQKAGGAIHEAGLMISLNKRITANE